MLIKHKNMAYSNLLNRYDQLHIRHDMLVYGSFSFSVASHQFSRSSAYTTLANAIPQIFNHIPNPMQIPIPPSASTSVSSVTAPNNPPGFNAFSILDPDNFPEIRYWTRKKFSANDVTELHDDDDNETAGKLGFLEHINGVRFTEEELKSVRKHAYESFSGLLEDGNAPLKWSQASSMASQRVRTEIVRQHPEIALCANNWKVDAVITETYGQWTTRRKEQIAESSKRRLQDAKSKKRKHTEEEEKEREHKRTKRDSESKKNERHKDKTRRRRNTIGDTDNIHSPRPDPADLNFTPDPDDNVSLPADNSASLDLEIGDDPALSLLDSARQSPEPQAAITVVATKPKKVTLSNPLLVFSAFLYFCAARLILSFQSKLEGKKQRERERQRSACNWLARVAIFCSFSHLTAKPMRQILQDPPPFLPPRHHPDRALLPPYHQHQCRIQPLNHPSLRHLALLLPRALLLTRTLALTHLTHRPPNPKNL